MNAAARALAQGLTIAANPASVKRIALSRQAILILSLVFAIVVSALSLVTIIDSNRIAFGTLSELQKTQEQLLVQRGQLLLEENTWAAPDRVESIARQNLALAQPTPQQVVILN